MSRASGGRAIDRRCFLLLRPTDRARVFELSGEQLYMRYVDARLPKRRDRLIERLRAELEEVDQLRVSGREWLIDDLGLRAEALFEELRGRGVRIE